PTPSRTSRSAAAGSSSTASTSSTATGTTPATPWTWSGRPGRPVPTPWCSATPTAACSRPGWGGPSPRCWRRPGCGWACTPRTTPGARWPTRWPRWTPAPPMCSAPPTATASGSATPTCSPWWRPWSSSTAAGCCRGGAWPRPPGSPRPSPSWSTSPPATHQTYVGVSAFAHKAGLHASAIKVDPDLYQHTDPALVGNGMRMLVSDMAGRASVELKAEELGVDLGGDRALVGRVVDRVEEMEQAGYSFEAADASLELLLREERGDRPRYFTAESWRAITERRADGASVSEATVKLHVKGERVITTAEGNGPVNALDRALRSAVEGVYTALGGIQLADYKVRILDGGGGTGAVTRILITFGDGRGEWTTVGVGENVIDASWTALEQAITYGLMRQGYPAP